MNIYEEYEIIYDIDKISDFFGNFSPFNLKLDVKYIPNEDLKQILEVIASLLQQGPHGKVFVDLHVLYFSNIKISYSKMRVGSKSKNKGKSNAYRAIVLVDNYSKRCFLLHIFSKNEKNNITKAEANCLNKLLNEYVNSVLKRERDNE